jgi:hypothetical protein
MKMKTGRRKVKLARRLGLPVPSKNGVHTMTQRMRAYTITSPATLRPYVPTDTSPAKPRPSAPPTDTPPRQ